MYILSPQLNILRCGYAVSSFLKENLKGPYSGVISKNLIKEALGLMSLSWCGLLAGLSTPKMNKNVSKGGSVPLSPQEFTAAFKRVWEEAHPSTLKICYFAGQKQLSGD